MITQNKRDKEARDMVEKKLALKGLKLPQFVWNKAVAKGYLDEIKQFGEKSVDATVKWIEECLEVAHAMSQDEEFEMENPTISAFTIEQDNEDITAYQKVVSILVAREAEKERDVQYFRRRVLGNKLLSLEELKPWIQQQAEQAKALGKGFPAFLSVPSLPNWQSSSVQENVTGRFLVQDVRQIATVLCTDATRMYSFPRPGETLFNEGNHSSTPVINELDWFSRDLADRYPWLAAQAAVFLLTGIPPVVETISGEIHLAQFRPLSRITLKIDPAISPQEVFEKYSAIRRIIVKKNQRNLSSKHLHLALFAATCAPGKGLEERKDEWNNACINEKWKYFRKTNFARDCAVAKKRVLNPDYTYPSRREDLYLQK